MTSALSPALARAALAATADGIVLLDPAGVMRGANSACATAFGVSEAALVGRRLGEFVEVSAADGGLAEALAAAGRGGWRGDLRRRPGAGESGIWEATLTPLAAKDGARSLIAVLRDARERHEREKMRADFLSVVTHDIKGPLTVILGYAEILGEADPPASPVVLSDTLARIRESGEQIHALVSNFVELARIEAGRHVVDRRALDLHELLERLVQNHAVRARRKGVELRLVDDEAPTVSADRPQIERAMVNLLGNAIKYTPPGGQVTVRTGRDGDRVAVAVRDTGPGIAAEELDDIFEKYRRATASRRVEGVGLGLFVSRAIARAHGGDVRVETALGRGSTFTLLLPADG